MSVSFCVGTGRCGTTLITELAGREANVAASHERLRLAACYHMFCKWHSIPADPEGFLSDRDELVAEDLREHDVSFESSALLSHSIQELFERFDAKFVLLVRRPDHTVGSFAARGWFTQPIPWRDRSLPPTIPDGMEPRHFFGRNLPRGEEAFARWMKLTQVGKIAWFWQARNGAILEQLRRLPGEHRRIQRIEELDFDRYQDLAQYLGWTATISRADFDELTGARLNTGPNPPRPVTDWEPQAVREFESEVRVVAEALGYEHRIDVLQGGASPLCSAVQDVA